MSTTFAEGPAHDLELQLARSPTYLRVVVNGAGAIDALDQLDDQAAADETVHVYELTSSSGPTHVCVRSGPGRGCHVITHAAYRHLHNVDGEPLRDNDAWARWACARAQQRDALTDLNAEREGRLGPR